MPDGGYPAGGHHVTIDAASVTHPPSREAPLAVAGGALATGLLAAVVLPGHAPGLNLLLVAVAVAAVAYAAIGKQVPRRALGFGGLSLALVVTSVLVAADWVLVVDLLVAVGVGSLAVAGGRTWLEVCLGATAFIWRMPPIPKWLLRPLAKPLGRSGPRSAAPLARGLVIGGFLLVVFGTLFATADRAFAQLAQELLIPRWEVGLLPLRMMVGGAATLFAGVVASFAPRALGPQVNRPSSSGVAVERPRRKLGRVEWMVALGLLDLLFAAFVIVQVTVLFGGRTHVLTTAGLTYAEYARSGFFQLVAVAVLTLLVLALAIRLAERTGPSDTIVLQVLGGTLCALTLVVLFSALRRLGLYEEVYGFTRLRISVHASILWLVGIFGLVLAGGAVRRFRWLPQTVVAYTGAALLAFTLINPDRVIATKNVERFNETGRIDVGYLAGLSADAVPALAELPEPLRSCALVDLRLELSEQDSMIAFNRGRDSARETLAQLPPRSTDTASCYAQPQERF